MPIAFWETLYEKEGPVGGDIPGTGGWTTEEKFDGFMFIT